MTEQIREALQELLALRGHGSWGGKWIAAWDKADAALSASPAPAEPVQQDTKPAFWVLTEQLRKRETTHRGYLWFVDPENSSWTPVYLALPHPVQPEEAVARELTSKEIKDGWEVTFSTNNPFCPCDLKSFTKAVNWAQWKLAALSRQQDAGGAK